MKALVKTRRGVGNLALLDRPEPRGTAGAAVIRVELAGLCGTDLHIADDEFPYWPPVTLGHEFTGTVESVSAGVDGSLIGQRVVGEPHAGACGRCGLCRRGVAELCGSKRSPGWGIDGAFAERVAWPAHLLHLVSDDLPDDIAVLSEPTAVAVTALMRAGIEPGDSVLVVGPGPVGILSAMAADALGASRVIIAGRHPGSRLVFAQSAGLQTVQSPEEALEMIRAATNGRGADLVVEATGEEAAVRLAIEAVRRRGRIAALGIGHASSIRVPWNLAIERSVSVVFSTSSSHTAWGGAIEVLRRRQDRLRGIGTVFPLADWEPAFQAARDRSVTKVLFSPRTT